MSDKNPFSINIDDEVRAVFGPQSHYNGIILGDFTALQADCEGALAIQGNAQFGSSGQTFDIGAAGDKVYLSEYTYIGDYDNVDQHPTLILGGLLDQKSRNCRFYNGDFLMPASNQHSYEANSVKLEIPDSYQIRYKQDELFDYFFSAVKENTKSVGANLAGSSTQFIDIEKLKNLHTMDLSGFSKHQLPEEYKAIVINIECKEDETVLISDVHFPGTIDNYDMVIVNAMSRHIRFASGSMLYRGAIVDTSLPKAYEGNKIVKALSKKLIWNFPIAETVEVKSYGILGSVIAPGAHLNGDGGSINGMIIVGSFYQKNGMELHGFTISGDEKIWKLIKEDPKGNIQVVKIDKDNGSSMLPDAEFKLYRFLEGEWQVNTDKLLTNQQGRLVIDGLELGEYKLVETKAPNGYKLPSETDTLFTISADENNKVVELEPITITNEPVKGQLEIIKVDADDHKVVLEGALFTLYKKENDEWEEYADNLETDSDGKLIVSELPLGDYKLVEIQAPFGYELPENDTTLFSIIVSESGDAAVKLEIITIANTKKKGRVQIKKVDADDSSAGLPGAIFDLYQKIDQDWIKISDDLAVDQDGLLTINDLIPGDYKLIETKEPYGYEMPENNETLFTISLDQDGDIVIMQLIEIANEKLRGSVEVIKVDQEDHDIRLPDAEFKLYKKVDGEWVECDVDLITGGHYSGNPAVNANE